MNVIRFVIRIPGLILIAMVRLYQKALSPWLGASCRFTPTCSTYMIQAIEKYGAVWGFIKGMWRIARCHPWGGQGHDPP